ncbi:MAG: hypothetical protein ACHQRM_08140 [Bacteroidia bacterium]
MPLNLHAQYGDEDVLVTEPQFGHHNARNDSSSSSHFSKVNAYLGIGGSFNTGDFLIPNRKDLSLYLGGYPYSERPVSVSEYPFFDVNIGLNRKLGQLGRTTFFFGPELDILSYKGSVYGYYESSMNGAGVFINSTTSEQWDYTFTELFFRIPITANYRITKLFGNYFGIKLGIDASIVLTEFHTGYLSENFQMIPTSFAAAGLIYMANEKGDGKVTKAHTETIELDCNSMLTTGGSNGRRFISIGLKFGYGFN